MARYINVDLTEAEIADKVQEITANADVFIAVRKVLGAVPAADVQKVKHANWIVDPDEGIARCSSCLNEFEDNGDTIPDYWYYCPNCGAKMDGGKADETRTDL